MIKWRRDSHHIDCRLLGYRSRRDIDALNDRYLPLWRRWWLRVRRLFAAPVPVAATVAVGGKWR